MGATLVMRFSIPEDQIKASGAFTPKAYASGRSLQGAIFRNGGALTYSANVPPKDMYSAVVPVAFGFNHQVHPSEKDRRPRSALVSSIAFEAK
jgi:hypothetical protein